MTKPITLFLHAILLAAALPAQAEPAPSPEFRVVAAAGVDAVVRAEVGAMVEHGLGRLAPLFPGTPTRPCSVTVHATKATLPATVRRSLHEGTAGVALLRRSEIHVILDASRNEPPHDLRTVVEHELVHILLDQFAAEAGPNVSRWFHEGLAQELSGGPYIGMSEDDLVLAAMADRLFMFSELHEDFPDDRNGIRRAYAQSFSFVGFLRERLGLETLLEAATRSTPEGGYRAGLVATTHEPMFRLVDAWREHLRSGSGAPMRFLQQNCFAFTVVLAFVLLALAAIRRFRRDDIARRKLERESREEDENAAEL